MNKKGMFFTILVISLLSLFVVAYASYSVIDERIAVNKRIETMNNFVFSLEQDMSRQNYISSYRAIVAIENYITNNGIFISSSEQAIKEAILNGTINNQNILLMQGYKLKDWNSRVSELADKVNLIVNYTLEDVTISQEDPWNIKIEVLINIFIKDKNNLASWNKSQVISSKIEIEGFEDPLYLINTNGKIVNKINKTNYVSFISGNDVSNLSMHLQNSYYISSPQAPSFLDRLEGKISANEQGIESLVYLPELSAQGIPAKDKSSVDYIYFSSQNPVSHHIQGMPSWFKLDDAHLDIYNATGLTID